MKSQTKARMVCLLWLALLCGCKPMSPSGHEGKPALTQQPPAIQSATASWTHYFDSILKTGDDVQRVRQLLADKSTEWGMLRWGGTGNYALRFKLNDYMQAEFNFDRSDKLQTYIVIGRNQSWVTDADHNIQFMGEK